MTEKLSYLLDANVFIEAARRYYAFDIAPGFWSNLDKLATSGRLYSIDRVKKELKGLKDELADWVDNTFSHAFVSTDEDNIIKCYADIMIWVNAQDQFKDGAKSEFAKSADGWLIAYAKVRDYVVVTHEVLSKDVRRKVPVPNVCRAFNVKFVDTFEMLRSLHVRFE